MMRLAVRCDLSWDTTFHVLLTRIAISRRGLPHAAFPWRRACVLRHFPLPFSLAVSPLASPSVVTLQSFPCRIQRPLSAPPFSAPFQRPIACIEETTSSLFLSGSTRPQPVLQRRQRQARVVQKCLLLMTIMMRLTGRCQLQIQILDTAGEAIERLVRGHGTECLELISGHLKRSAGDDLGLSLAKCRKQWPHGSIPLVTTR